jgi:hypothetical protein
MPGAADEERSVSGELWAILRSHVDEGALDWLSQATLGLGVPPDRTRLRVAFSRAGRRLGDRRVDPSTDASARLRELGCDVPLAWSASDLGRAVLLLAALECLTPGEQLDWALQLFRTGELGEQVSVVRILPLLPDPERFAALAAEATRTNATRVFEALACDNPYPARHLTDLAFEQMVMKAIFTEIPIARIPGLRGRVTAELVRMAQDYASERHAAGRTVPSDIAILESWLETQP